MNWQAISFDWNQVRAFLATAEEGSFSAAARALKQTQPTLGRQVAGLEDRLGVTLFERVGRGVALTAPGRELLAHVRDMAEAANRVSLSASGQSQAVEGKVRITASDIFAVYLLPRAIHRIRERAPRLQIEVIAANDIRDLLHREADIAIRHVRPEQPELIARLLLEEKAYFYGSAAYFAARGHPRTLEELATHEFISMGDNDRMIEYMKPLGLHLTHASFSVGSENGIVSWELGRQGFGLVPMSEEVAEATPGMIRARTRMDPISFPAWLVTHRELHTARRIRLVFDTLTEVFARTGTSPRPQSPG